MKKWVGPHRLWRGTLPVVAPDPDALPVSPRLAAKPPPQRFKVLLAGAAPVIVDIHDGDTFRLVLVIESEAGVGIWPWLRLDGCDAFELNEPGGEEAHAWTIAFLAKASHIDVTLFGWSFDRRVARVIADNVDMTQAIIAAGHAVPWKRPSR